MKRASDSPDRPSKTVCVSDEGTDRPQPPPLAERFPYCQREAGARPPEWDKRWRRVNGQWRWECSGPHDRRELANVLSDADCDELAGVWQRCNYDLYEGTGPERREKKGFERPAMPPQDRAIFQRLASKAVDRVAKEFGIPLDLDQATLSSTNSVGHQRHADNELFFVRRKNPPVDVPLPQCCNVGKEMHWQTHPIEPDRVCVAATGESGVLVLRYNDEPEVKFRSVRYDSDSHSVVCGERLDGAPDRVVGLMRGPPVRKLLGDLRTMAQDASIPDAKNIAQVVSLEGVACGGADGRPCVVGAPAAAAVECTRCGLRHCQGCNQVHDCRPIDQAEACMRGLADVDWRAGPTAHRNFGMSVCLSHRQEYVGGGVHFVKEFGDSEYCASYYCDRGCGVAFCGCRKNIHSVEPVTSGRRLVLLLWTRPRGAAPPQGAFGALPRPGTGPGVWLTMGDDGI